MPMANVNFPEDLDISPLVHRHGPSMHSEKVVDTFGHAAQRDAIRRYGIAGRVWEAAFALQQYIQPPADLIFDPPFIPVSPSQSPMTILELGSGIGIVASCVTNVLDASKHILIATDLPEVCPLLTRNLEAHIVPNEPKNSMENAIFVRPLAWGNEYHCRAIALELSSSHGGSRMLTHIICSDLIYFPELLAPLLRTLIHLSAPPFSQPPTRGDAGVTILISYKVRSLPKETPFWLAFGLWFDFEPVLVTDTTVHGQCQQHGAVPDDTPFIFIAHRRPESFHWTIPMDDQDLLSGRGAMGNDAAKSDDTFETLLFMRLGSLYI